MDVEEQTLGRRLLQKIMAIGPLSPLSLSRNLVAVLLARDVFPRQALTDLPLLLPNGPFAAEEVPKLPRPH